MTQPETVVERIGGTPRKPLKHMAARFDMGRETDLFVTTNLDGWPHLTAGNQVTMIMHPHFAKRLMDALQQVIDGKDFAR